MYCRAVDGGTAAGRWYCFWYCPTQVEGHPYFRNDAVLGWCQDQGIHVTAYSPLGTPHTAAFFKRQAPEVLKASDVPLI